MKKFEHELESLMQRVMQMGEAAESMVASASSALAERDFAMIQAVRDIEPTLDRFQVELDGEAIRLMTVYSPIAKDLRFLLMVTRIVSELERIGDQALNNVQSVEAMRAEPRPPDKVLADLTRMSDITRTMLRDALRAFDTEDIERAQQVLKADDEVDRLNAETFRDLLTDKTVTHEVLNQYLHLILVARSVERIADHATNICEEVIYVVKGEDIRHQTE